MRTFLALGFAHLMDQFEKTCTSSRDADCNSLWDHLYRGEKVLSKKFYSYLVGLWWLLQVLICFGGEFWFVTFCLHCLCLRLGLDLKVK